MLADKFNVGQRQVSLRTPQGVVKARTAQANQIRGLLAEFGIVCAVSYRRAPSFEQYYG